MADGFAEKKQLYYYRNYFLNYRKKISAENSCGNGFQEEEKTCYEIKKSSKRKNPPCLGGGGEEKNERKG